MRDLSAIPPAMTDIDGVATWLIGFPLGDGVGRSTHPARGGDVGKGSRRGTRSIVPHSHTPQRSQQEADGPVSEPELAPASAGAQPAVRDDQLLAAVLLVLAAIWAVWP